MQQRHRGKDLVAFGAVIAASIFGTWLFLRTQLDIGSDWTDGTERFEAVQGERIRYAVWDAPAPFEGDANGEESESRPAISPDGRWLVFCAGERGLNADLYVAELVAGKPEGSRPLSILNSEFDELAPAFGADGLYFATNRTGAAFGLDLWHASFANGVFGVPEPIATGVNTAADESDPCPVPGSRDLLFSSNRTRGARTDFDLYVASPSLVEEPEAATKETTATDSAFGVALLVGLNTPFDEREPALTSDGRTLIFASDRNEGFDLYRSFLEEGAWLPAAPLVGVNTWRSERGPLLSADGFSLFFDVSDDEQRADLWRAHSKELFRIPAPPLSLTEILILLGLFVLAILAWLSKRWHAIDVIYKCFLISLLIHLGLMWYLREVYPESPPVAMNGEEQVYRVRLARSEDGMPASARERGGELQVEARTVQAAESAPSRVESGAEVAAAAPSRNEVAQPERTLVAPTRRDAELGENRSLAKVEPELQERDAPYEPLAENAPGLALDASKSITAASATATESATPARAATGAEAQRATPTSTQRTATRDANDAAGDAPGLQRSQRTNEAQAPESIDIAMPQEVFELARAEAPAMNMPEATVAAAPERQSGAKATRHVESADSAPYAPSGARPDMDAAVDLTPARELDTAAAEPRVATLESRQERSDPSVQVRNVPDAVRGEQEAHASARFDATEDLAQSSAERAQPNASDPQRFDVSPSRSRTPDATPVRSNLAGIEPSRAVDRTADMPSMREAQSPRQLRDEPGPAVAVRSIDEPVTGADVTQPEPRRFDPVADLAQREPQRYRPTPTSQMVPNRPSRRKPDAPVVPARRSFAPVVAAVDAPVEPMDEVPDRIEHTPYRNRFGDEKLRALEEFGGGLETERAVSLGLDYLASIQSERGAWGDRDDHDDKYGDVRMGKTALALLAFLGAGHTPESETRYSAVSANAVRFLLSKQSKANGHFSDASSYGHGIATYALAECYALTQDKELRGPLELAIARVLSKQDRRSNARLFGGWGYYFKNDRVWNGDDWPRVSVTAWQVMALESAKIGGLEIPEAAFDNAQTFLLNAWDRQRGAFRYSHDPDRLNSGYPILPASTPAALFGLSLLGVDVTRPELADARRFVLRRAPSDYRFTGPDDFVQWGRGNLYFWYYATLAMFRVGGDEWERWNVSMKDTLLESQGDDGSWMPLSTYAREYAGDDNSDRSYATAMCVLTLEIYYRYFTPLLSARD